MTSIETMIMYARSLIRFFETHMAKSYRWKRMETALRFYHAVYFKHFFVKVIYMVYMVQLNQRYQWKGNVCIRATWPIRPELIPVSL